MCEREHEEEGEGGGRAGLEYVNVVSLSEVEKHRIRVHVLYHACCVVCVCDSLFCLLLPLLSSLSLLSSLRPSVCVCMCRDREEEGEEEEDLCSEWWKEAENQSKLSTTDRLLQHLNISFAGFVYCLNPI